MSEKTIYDGSDLITALSEKTEELEKALNDMLVGGVALAAAERVYREKLREWTIRLKKQNISAGMIDKMVLGVEEVSTARYDRDVAQAVYDVRKERINATKLEIRILENQISREYAG